MAKIELDQVKHIADIARLALTGEEAEKYTKQLEGILTMVETLNEVDTTDVKPTTHVIAMRNVMREDKAGEGLPIEDVLKNAPDHEDRQIRVPSIIE
ncbi:Asp-tRNA(Asn)/Glu-tRNA(Gln) amidotransferase subunit GatC [bacterium LRH843]|nr:Asp-tRNA(Asn)/Glu-tRNA(Gln) amidotransferase subunit GatC [bacterium LRH843]